MLVLEGKLSHPLGWSEGQSPSLQPFLIKKIKFKKPTSPPPKTSPLSLKATEVYLFDLIQLSLMIRYIHQVINRIGWTSFPIFNFFTPMNQTIVMVIRLKNNEKSANIFVASMINWSTTSFCMWISSYQFYIHRNYTLDKPQKERTVQTIPEEIYYIPKTCSHSYSHK